MKIRAVIFDIYDTLLERGLPPSDAEARWVALWLETFGGPPRFDLAGFGAACEGIIAREHASARAIGIAYPEIYWPDVVIEVLPELARSTAKSREAFIFRHAALKHTVKLNPITPGVLRSLHGRGVLIGLASNCQPHTLAELETEFSPTGLSLDIVHPALRFLSFEQGFSKPDPHVFRLVRARLRGFGVASAETLIVGDREDNDIAPAKAQCFPTWLLGPIDAPDAGGWKELSQRLEQEWRAIET